MSLGASSCGPDAQWATAPRRGPSALCPARERKGTAQSQPLGSQGKHFPGSHTHRLELAKGVKKLVENCPSLICDTFWKDQFELNSCCNN